MIPDLDFLPASYHEKRHQRQKKSWRVGILVAFCILVVLGSVQIQSKKTSLRNERDRLKLQTQQLEKQLAFGKPVQLRIQQLDQQLDLLALMKARVPTTRLLRTVTDSLPQYVSLTSIRLNVGKVIVPTSTISVPRRKSSRKKKSEAKELSATEKDLKAIRESQLRQATFVMVEGIAPDDVAISTILRGLRQSEHFTDVSLIYTDSYLKGETTLRTFSMKLRVRRMGEPASQTSSMQTAVRIQEELQ